MCKFSEDSKQKLGNTIIYIAERTPQLSKTKLLKLLFLMEEYMVKRYHVPFLALPYEVWQAGPVAKDVFIDLSDGVVLLKDFIKTKMIDGAMYIFAIKPFSEDEFSECEIEMMDEVIKRHGNKTAKQIEQGKMDNIIAQSIPADVDPKAVIGTHGETVQEIYKQALAEMAKVSAKKGKAKGEQAYWSYIDEHTKSNS